MKAAAEATAMPLRAAISVAHKAQRLPSPVSSPLVRATMRGVRREHGTAQRQAAPLLREDLFIVLGAMGDRLKDLRDRAGSGANGRIWPAMMSAELPEGWA